MKRYTSILLLLLIVVGCKDKEEAVLPIPQSVHLSLGNPSNAKADTNTPNNYLMLKSQYTLSYNRSYGHANWVSWELSPEWLGTSDRQDDFRPDTALPSSWYKVKTSDYTNSGFDRGHLCPSADRTSTLDNNSSTFLMTNIIPQAPQLNREAWARLEDYCRTLVDKGYHLYIIAGAYGTGGKGSNGTVSTIKGLINVPAHNYKIIVAVANGGSSNNINADTPVIAVDFPNSISATDNKSWNTFVTTPAAIEQSAGITLFTALPNPVRSKLREVRFDPTTTTLGYWMEEPSIHDSSNPIPW